MGQGESAESTAAGYFMYADDGSWPWLAVIEWAADELPCNKVRTYDIPGTREVLLKFSRDAVQLLPKPAIVRDEDASANGGPAIVPVEGEDGARNAQKSCSGNESMVSMTSSVPLLRRRHVEPEMIELPEEYALWASSLLRQDENLRTWRYRNVPSRVSEKEFWRYYFHHAFYISRRKLLGHASNNASSREIVETLGKDDIAKKCDVNVPLANKDKSGGTLL